LIACSRRFPFSSTRPYFRDVAARFALVCIHGFVSSSRDGYRYLQHCMHNTTVFVCYSTKITRATELPTWPNDVCRGYELKECQKRRRCGRRSCPCNCHRRTNSSLQHSMASACASVHCAITRQQGLPRRCLSHPYTRRRITNVGTPFPTRRRANFTTRRRWDQERARRGGSTFYPSSGLRSARISGPLKGINCTSM